jgi:hypothetical protein
MKMENELTKIFDLPSAPVEVVTKRGEVITVNDDRKVDQKLEDDFEQSRQRLNSLLFQGEDALQHALEIAKTSENPRAFEVVSNMIKQLADINNQLLQLHKQRSDLENKNGGGKQESGPHTVNNNMFVGTTADLNKMMHKALKGD